MGGTYACACARVVHMCICACMWVDADFFGLALAQWRRHDSRGELTQVKVCAVWALGPLPALQASLRAARRLCEERAEQLEQHPKEVARHAPQPQPPQRPVRAQVDQLELELVALPALDHRRHDAAALVALDLDLSKQSTTGNI